MSYLSASSPFFFLSASCSFIPYKNTRTTYVCLFCMRKKKEVDRCEEHMCSIESYWILLVVFSCVSICLCISLFASPIYYSFFGVFFFSGVVVFERGLARIDCKRTTHTHSSHVRLKRWRMNIFVEPHFRVIIWTDIEAASNVSALCAYTALSVVVLVSLILFIREKSGFFFSQIVCVCVSLSLFHLHVFETFNKLSWYDLYILFSIR